MNQAWSQDHFQAPASVVEPAAKTHTPIDPVRVAVWLSFFAAVPLSWVAVLWLLL
jgi:hypothetical protein